MMYPLLLLRTCLTYFLCGLLIVIFILPCFIIACLPQRLRQDNRLFFYLLNLFFTGVTYASGNPVRISGKEHLPHEPAIFVANHQSAFDIPVVGSLCTGYPHVWLVLAYYVKMPVLGFFITRMFVPVEQDKSVKAAESLRKIIRLIQDRKRHLIIFPEGERVTDGTIHRFQPGFAMMAKRTGMSVVPVYLAFNDLIYPPASFYIYSYPVIAVIGEPMTMGEDEIEEVFVERVQQWFITLNAHYRS